MNFKTSALTMTSAEITTVYRVIEAYSGERETDLNDASLKKILKYVIGPKVLDVGCGRGYLVKKLAKKFRVTGTDIVIDERLKHIKQATFRKAPIEQLPFPDSSFDTVICTHTLEHVSDISPALKELRRVARSRLIIVVPKQRPYRYTFDLHLQFYPYTHLFLQAVRSEVKYSCEVVNGDIFFTEDYE